MTQTIGNTTAGDLSSKPASAEQTISDIYDSVTDSTSATTASNSWRARSISFHASHELDSPYKPLVYTNSGTSFTLIGIGTATALSSTLEWVTAPFSSLLLDAGVQYRPAIISTTMNTNMYRSYVAGGVGTLNGYGDSGESTYDTPSNFTAGAELNAKISMYLTYSYTDIKKIGSLSVLPSSNATTVSKIVGVPILSSVSKVAGVSHDY